jgi:hypothetical protein
MQWTVNTYNSQYNSHASDLLIKMFEKIFQDK